MQFSFNPSPHVQVNSFPWVGFVKLCLKYNIIGHKQKQYMDYIYYCYHLYSTTAPTTTPSSNSLNTFHAAGVSRRQVSQQTFHKSLKNVNIMEFGDYILKHHKKCIQISTNMRDIGLEMCDTWRVLRNKTIFILNEILKVIPNTVTKFKNL